MVSSPRERAKLTVGLPKQHRLKQRHDFNRVYQKGARFKSSALTLRIVRRAARPRPDVRSSTHPSPNGQIKADLVKSSAPITTNPMLRQADRSRSQPTRIGISISTKVDKRSVVRNRIRRQLQASFRQFLPSIAPGWDVLIIVHPPAVQCDYSQFLRELEQLLIEAEVIHGDPRGCVL